MVLERLFPASWVERRGFFAFLLGVCYSVIGLGLAVILFPQDPALVAVAFTGILLLPEIDALFGRETKIEEHEKRPTIRKAWRDNKQFFKAYMFLVLGIFIVYCLGAILLESMAAGVLFREQLEMRGVSANIAGDAIDTGLLSSILQNNLLVVLACFLLAFFTGDGAVFLLVWNASVWGTIFGITAKNAALFTQKNPFIYLFLILLVVLPHAIIEISAYVFAAISGGAISKEMIRKRLNPAKFRHVLTMSMIVLTFALVALLVGSLVESFVLENSRLYATIIAQSYYAG